MLFRSDFIWTRNGSIYYLGKVEGNWFYTNDLNSTELDIPNQIFCKWTAIGNEEKVPGKIVASFRAPKSFQKIKDDILSGYIKEIFTKGA